MKQLPMFCLAALLGAAVSLPAQVSIEARFGSRVRADVSFGYGGHGHHRHPGRSEPIRRVTPAPRGHWDTVWEQVLVPGYWHEEHVPPTYGWVADRCGHRRWGVVDPGGCRQVWVPARYESRPRRVWVPC